MLALVASCGARSCPTIAERSGCVPYVEAAGTHAIPPAGWITFRSGIPLTVTSVPPSGGKFEVAPVADETYRGFGGGRVYFAREVQIADGVRARGGATAALGGAAGGELGVYPSNNQMYLVPCGAIASAPREHAPADPAPVTAERLRVLLEGAHLIPASQYGDEGCCSTLWRLGPGQQVELLSVDGNRAEVRFERDGYVYTGLVAEWSDGQVVLRADLLGVTSDRGDPEMLIGQNPGGDSIVMLGKRDPMVMTSFGASCSGTALLRARSPMFSGPIRTRAASDNKTPVREIPVLDRDVEVTLRSVLDDFRAVEIANPTPEVASIVAWVRDSDLDRPTCEAP